MKPLLHAEKIHKKFYDPQKVTILKEVCLEVHAGQSIAIVGASGQGKSTLLQILGTLETFDYGSLKIAGKSVQKRNAPLIRNRHIGFVFQSFHLLDNYTALENSLMPAKIAREDISKNSYHYKRMSQLFKEVGLEDRLHFRSNLLSGGEKQRVSIARALCNDPELILADEPSGNLDRTTSEQIHTLLLNLCQKQNKGLIVVTHNLELAALCSHTYTLQDGMLHRGQL